LQQLRQADVIHVRCPANISQLAIILLALRRHPRRRWFKYAGNWMPQDNEAMSYKLQRWWLQKGFARGQVTVNGQWPAQPAHVHSFLNPCLTEEELREGRETAGNKQFRAPVNLLFVGRLDCAKGVARCLEILAQLRERGVPACLELVGDGPDRSELTDLANAFALDVQTTFHGWLPRAAINRLYARAHFILLPSQCSEGWPKVLSEAMAWGAVPLASDVSSIPHYFKQFQTGRTFAANNIAGVADAVCEYLYNPASWRTESENAVKAAQLFSYSAYLEKVGKLLEIATVSESNKPLLEQGRQPVKEF
jgi:glycosyltransferase involved in cell wall biosynthesis